MRRRRSEPPVSLFSFQDIITSVTGVLILFSLILSLALLAAPVKPIDNSQVDADSQSRPEEIAELEEQVAKLESQTQTAAETRKRFSGMSLEELRRTLGALGVRREELTAKAADAESRMAAIPKDIAERAVQEAAELADKLRDLEQLRAALSQEVALLTSGRAILYNPAPGTEKVPWLVDVSDKAIVVHHPIRATIEKSFEGGGEQVRVREFQRWAMKMSERDGYFVVLIRPSGVSTFDRIYADLRRRGFEVGFDVIQEDAEILRDTGERL